MGGFLFYNVEQDLIQALRKDNSKKLKELILNKGLNPDTLYTKRKRTLVQLSCYFLSPKCLSILIELNYDYNKKETINNYTPLYIACKFNCLPIVKILLAGDFLVKSTIIWKKSSLFSWSNSSKLFATIEVKTSI